ncbi:hypothetical protein CYLTODRAFT_425560 [Cylindrobasidium torrendii FP15055 ss-10]|uniref:BAH domain-containing protein n=1 Tax=Cylindrobasidium torrendii FP15055 ss-10 TaxID=1314674 RepID=A0A0D7B1L7_9AGAR|nr:hypothetical protein CYLTODRAFT_425560 [Cylindrobasidium torrendii FP15055 ss-10]
MSLTIKFGAGRGAYTIVIARLPDAHEKDAPRPSSLAIVHKVLCGLADTEDEAAAASGHPALVLQNKKRKQKELSSPRFLELMAEFSSGRPWHMFRADWWIEFRREVRLWQDPTTWDALERDAQAEANDLGPPVGPPTPPYGSVPLPSAKPIKLEESTTPARFKKMRPGPSSEEPSPHGPPTPVSPEQSSNAENARTETSREPPSTSPMKRKHESTEERPRPGRPAMSGRAMAQALVASPPTTHSPQQPQQTRAVRRLNNSDSTLQRPAMRARPPRSQRRASNAPSNPVQFTVDEDALALIDTIDGKDIFASEYFKSSVLVVDRSVTPPVKTMYNVGNRVQINTGAAHESIYEIASFTIGDEPPSVWARLCPLETQVVIAKLYTGASTMGLTELCPIYRTGRKPCEYQVTDFKGLVTVPRVEDDQPNMPLLHPESPYQRASVSPFDFYSDYAKICLPTQDCRRSTLYDPDEDVVRWCSQCNKFFHEVCLAARGPTLSLEEVKSMLRGKQRHLLRDAPPESVAALAQLPILREKRSRFEDTVGFGAAPLSLETTVLRAIAQSVQELDMDTPQEQVKTLETFLCECAVKEPCPCDKKGCDYLSQEVRKAMGKATTWFLCGGCESAYI